MVTFADGTQLIVVDPGPPAALHRVLSPFMKRLPQEFRTGSSELNGSSPSARYGYWCNAGGALHFMSVLVSLAIPHGREQARRHDRPGSGQRLHDGPTRMLATDFSDGDIELLDTGLHLL